MLLDFFETIQRLNYIERCSNTPHIRPYPVSQHSFYIALYSMFFATFENHRIAEENLKNFIDDDRVDRIDLFAPKNPEEDMPYDIGLVVQKALVHDLEESITGDILYPLHKEFNEFKKKLDEVRIYSVNKKLFSKLPFDDVRDYYIKLWEEAKDLSQEGILVACMDKFEILMFAVTELSMGNKAFKIIYDNAINIIEREFNIPSVNRVIKEIKAKVIERAILGSVSV